MLAGAGWSGAAGRRASHDNARAGPGGPRTTVVIPVWDEPYTDLVEEAAASVRAQSRRAEIVVVDNRSDAPVAVPPGAAVIRTERRLSRGEARNLALREVVTDFVLFLDADDLLLPGALEQLETHLDTNPECAACAMSILEGEVGRAGADGRHSVPRPFVPALSRLRPLFAMACAMWPLYSTQGATLIRADAISEHAYADSDGGEDWALAVSLAMRGVTVMGQPGLIYRRHPKGGGWADPLSTGYMPQGAADVRSRLRSDSAAPRWLRASLPAVWLAHLLLLRVVWPLAIRLRRG